MHEVALSTQLAGVVTRAAAGRTVHAVHIKVGALRQVVPTSLDYAWGFATKGTAIEGAALEVEWIPAVIECDAGHRRQLDPEQYLDMRCTECSAPTRAIAGEEFSVVDIEVSAQPNRLD